MNIDQIICVNPEIMSGVPVFTGTRVPVQSLIDHILGGDSLEDFLEGFPTMARRQAEAFVNLAFHKVMDGVEYACAA